MEEKQAKKDRKEKIRDALRENGNASVKKNDNENAARKWIAKKLAPAFDELKEVLNERFNINYVEHNAAETSSLKSTLKFIYEQTNIQYSVVLYASSKDITGKTSFMVVGRKEQQVPKHIPSILDWEEKQIIDDFSEAYTQYKKSRD